MRVNLAGEPEVIGIASALDMDEFSVVGRLFALWAWADQHTADGNAACVTESWIDRYTNAPGFAAAMAKVGWLVVGEGGITFPNFDRHNGKSAKKRALTKERVEKKRNAASVTKALPEKSERESEREIPIVKNSMGERDSIGATDSTSDSGGGGNNHSPRSNQSNHSPKNFSRRTEEEPLDVSDLDWSHVAAMAEAVGRRVPARTEDDRRAWLRYAALAETVFSEAWLVDAAEAVANATETRATRQAHFVGVLQAKALELHGVDGETLTGMARRIEIPTQVWKSRVLEVRR